MDATEVIDSYVHDVARRLPLGKRDDVAFELRALLTDELGGLAEAQGRAPDREMAVAMLREFGRPADVAVRYYRPFTIIGPGDTWSFLVAAIAGGVLVSLLASSGPSSTASGELTQRANLAFFAWLGALVVVFGAKSLILRYRPDAFAWTPRRVRDTDSVSRAGAVVVALAWLALLACYLVPGRVADLVSGGRVAAGSLAYSASFLNPWRMAWLVGLLAIAAGLQLVVAVQGRWRPATRWARMAVTALVALQLGWHASYGAIFADARTERAAVPAFAWLSGVILVWCGILLYREYSRVRPAPASA
jgi:hypothetical protein